ncbi:MAG: imidazolonepropionase [Crocinitomicaceae bacterium]|nr:imidazolonepropionase [Crocinitomicaceae bacterium]|tara:strand:- start:4277 stop:5524 length:1248 start_codon:yes stop_codon:yes gene_type:complete
MKESKQIIINIKQLVGILKKGETKLCGEEMNNIYTIENAFLEITDNLISGFGKMEDFQINDQYSVFEAKGKVVFPSWNDSHTHLVFAGTREKEFIDRINGLSYEEIAARGGGILNSANLLEITSEDDLFLSSSRRLEEVMKMGTGAIEIKSGYGLSHDGELKMLRVIKRLQESYDIPIKSTFLGAHALPKKYKNNKDQYINLIVNEMLPNIKEEELADYIDVFCETNYFSVDDMQKVIEAGHKYGLKPKVHVNQFTSIGGIQKAIEWNAVSVDHLEVMSENDFESLSNSDTIATLLPSCSFFIDIPYAPARKLITKNIPFALASDYNPGSSPNGNMNLVNALAAIKMKISPQAAINASTINGAYAMELADKTGSITIGKWANINISSEINSYGFMPYSFGQNHIEKSMIKGTWIN